MYPFHTPTMELSITLALLIAIATTLTLYFLTRTKKPSSGDLPPGSLGLPVIGQSLCLLRAMRTNTGEQWLQKRVDKYGPISKLSLFGAPTVFLTGPAANKFIFANDALAMQQPEPMKLILGKKNILELVGDDHKRVRGAVAQFLRPDMLKMYMGKIDGVVRYHVEKNWIGHPTVTVLPLMKMLTFDIISSLLFGLERGPVKEGLADDFTHMVKGMWAVPINLPFTAFSRSLKASARARKVLTRITREKNAKLEQGKSSPNEDLISYFLSLRSDNGAQLLTEEEIVDNAMVVLVAGHDTSSLLVTFMMRHLANDPVTLAAMVQEHEEIAKNKAAGDALTWEDLTKMKYTWRVALETMRIIPPIFGGFRVALQDIKFGGYCIPKGWHVFWASNVTHMDPNIFHEPMKFDPSRFENQSSVQPYSFVSFGGGPRVCPGVEFARIETLVTMHYLVRQFKWKLCCKENTFRRDPTPTPLQGLPIALEHKTSLCKSS